jgi:hypothetical protein
VFDYGSYFGLVNFIMAAGIVCLIMVLIGTVQCCC